ncbi:MAG: class I SAM-dependent methyltransferase [Planctomycetaceae bacterium]|nr:class I SAM-dependent methyltransferase [Planctomycetaceae bacterium]
MNGAEKKKRILSHYDPRVKDGREGFEVADWADARSQHARFDVLIAHVPLAGKSLLDVGCGVGDLYALLQARGLDVRYAGVDLSAKVIEAARERFAGKADFRVADVFDDPGNAPAGYDVTFASGTFNLTLGDNLAFLAHAARRLVELAHEAAVFNFLDDRATHRVDYCHYYNLDDVQPILDALPCRTTIVRDYLPHDTTVICWKEPRG